MSNFYVFKRPELSDRNDADTEIWHTDAKRGEAPVCPTCKEPLGSLRLLPPIHMVLELLGHYFGDVAFVGGSSQLVISASLQEAFIQRQLIGLYDFFPVTIVGIRSKNRNLNGNCPSYRLCSVSWGNVIVDTRSSGFEWESGPECPDCRRGNLLKRWSRVVIDSDTWSGEDVFRPRNLPGTILVTTRFRDMYLECGFRNGVFIPAEEYGHDFYPWEKEKTTGET